MKAVLPALARPLLEGQLPAALDVSWFTTPDEAKAMIADADIAWTDMQGTIDTAEIWAEGTRLRWVSTIRAGVDEMPLDHLRSLGAILTNGTGLNADTVADYAVLAVLAAAKRYDEVVRMADRHEWGTAAPGTMELDGSAALVIGYGTIGQRIGDRLKAFGVRVTGVTRSGRDGTLASDAWRSRLGEFDWVVLAAPATGDTSAMIGTDELAAMKSTGWLVNFGRGAMVDQEALVTALRAGSIGGAFLDTVSPEPLPADDPLWTAPNCILSMHLSGRSQTSMFTRGAKLFAANLSAFLGGRPMANLVDLDLGY